MRWIQKINGVMAEFAGLERRPEWYLERGWIGYPGTLPLSRLDIVDGKPIELSEPEPILPDTSRLDAACNSFREICFNIGKLIEVDGFRGGFDEMSIFQASDQASTIQGIGLALQWVAADKLCTYEASKIGIGQPEWWYCCWGINQF